MSSHAQESASVPQWWRAFSLYGVNHADRVASCQHFRAPSVQEAVQRAQEQMHRFHKVEVWERSTCVFEAFRPAGFAEPNGSALIRLLRRLRP